MDRIFRKHERLTLKRRIDPLIQQGESLFLFPFKLLWLPCDLAEESTPAQIAITVPKKYQKRAVARNRIKRRTREAYRLQKAGFYQALNGKNRQVVLLLIYVSHDILSYAEIEQKLNEIFKRLIRVL